MSGRTSRHKHTARTDVARLHGDALPGIGGPAGPLRSVRDDRRVFIAAGSLEPSSSQKRISIKTKAISKEQQLTFIWTRRPIIPRRRENVNPLTAATETRRHQAHGETPARGTSARSSISQEHGRISRRFQINIDQHWKINANPALWRPSAESFTELLTSYSQRKTRIRIRIITAVPLNHYNHKGGSRGIMGNGTPHNQTNNG
ncbi:hypothetical protein ROHU_014530 [Labeo rohita]|uniref:Uncharacterized protein n=1 Tax=Labeo rohita TaxID=84645 RepID=A0A498NTR9_LABRO|nr:hypothetical protein ROHU_014530 [Labeo rohita]